MKIVTYLSPIVLIISFPFFAFAGSQTYSTPGSYSFSVPSYSTLTVTVTGAGGGGGSGNSTAASPGGSGGSGGYSSFDSVIAYGGGGGGSATGAGHPGYQPGAAGSPGGAGGGDSNTSGGGAAGGAGGGGSVSGGSGGAGGSAVKTYSFGALTPNSTISVVVGAAGAGEYVPYGAYPCCRFFQPGSDGSSGSVSISWTDPPPLLQCNGGAEIYSTPGTYARTIPGYTSMIVEAWGGGGGGGGNGLPAAYAPSGGASSFNGSLVAGGGSGGGGYTQTGSGGSASGGDINTNGNGGSSQNGGAAPNGGAGGAGAGITNGPGHPGSAPGGGGGGAGYIFLSSSGYGAGSGAYVKKTYTTGALTVGSPVTIVVGSGGAGGSNGPYLGGSGGNGQVSITCSAVAAPTCSIFLDQNPVAYGSGTTLHWSSSNTDTSFYINNVGYVTSNTSASTSVQPAADTDYSGTAVGSGGTTTCAASSGTPAGTLNVTPPSTPTTTITASSTSIYTNHSTGLHATFSAGSGDTLTHDNIDSPVGNGLGASTNPDANKYITFTPSSAGSYTFYARAQTGYFTSWTTYASTIVTVTDPPSCTPTYTCSGNNIQYTNNTCDVSTVATCTSPAYCSAGSSTCLYPPPSYNQSGGLTGHLQVVPSLVPQNMSTKLFWDLSNVASCSVSGTNGDNWTGTSSGSGGKTSAAITQQTVYTLSCIGLDTSTTTEAVTVNVLPVFQER